ncbi:uncharacterized protein LOC6576433 isoform X2 [Drosophila mojavensis]|uniref:Uncharacterized protein, isoform A n=1 Tax=Drosophila mojavensis TaxID=7230 RepID=B4KEI6_DROMO|nr:uncharacterized protein LOC6576433 isoform X2 [Drosophila mojavensis]EDW11865.2 uncharacterized protein Dmoj_GI12869, isoform A [Drosophila mojavensis]
MGAEQSALLACTQTGKPESPLNLENSKQFFQLYFDRMPEPKTGPVTEALLHLIMNAPHPNLEFRERANWANQQEQDSGYENDELEMEESSEADEEEQDIDMISVEEEQTVDQLSESGMSTASSSTTYDNRNIDESNVQLIPLEFVNLQPFESPNIDDPQLEFEKEFIISIADLNEELS